MLFPKDNSVSGHTCAQIFTSGEGFVWIMPFFSKAEVGKALRALAKQLGIPNYLHFDRYSEYILLHSGFLICYQGVQYQMEKFRTLLTLAESC